MSNRINLPELLVALEALGIKASSGGGDSSAAIANGFVVTVGSGGAISVETPNPSPLNREWLSLKAQDERVAVDSAVPFIVVASSLPTAIYPGATYALAEVTEGIAAAAAQGSGRFEDGFGIVQSGEPMSTGGGRPLVLGYVRASAIGDDPFEDARIGRAAVAQGSDNPRAFPAVTGVVDNFDGTYDLTFAAAHGIKPWETVTITGFTQDGAHLLNGRKTVTIVDSTTVRVLNPDFLEITDTSCSVSSGMVYTGGIMKSGAIWVIPRFQQKLGALDVEGAMMAANGVDTDYGAGYGLHWHDGVSRRRIGHGARSVTCTAGNEVVTAASGIIRGVDKLMLTAAAAVTVGTAATKPILPDSYDGHTICLINVGANNITLTDQGTMAASNLRLTATTVVLGARDSVELTYSSTVGDWVQTGNLVNVL